MYRTNDPRFRRRLHDISATLESANESAQSGLYIFGERYIKPCLGSFGACLTSCVDASCPSLNISQSQRERERRRRQRGRGRAELSFDFYDDWDDELEGEGLGWGNDEFDRLVGGGGRGGYGTVSAAAQQPGRQRGMSYPKARRKSVPHEAEVAGVVVPGSSGFWSRLFGGKSVRYKPSAADLQEHPGARRHRRDRTEGEALLDDIDEDTGHRTHRRARSGTQGTAASESSFSSRGDLFPSDEETDAIPLDDEFAMVLERRTIQSGNVSGTSGQETESASSGKTRDKRGKRPSAGSRTSTRRTASSKSLHSTGGRKSSTRSRAGSNAAPIDETAGQEDAEPKMSLAELKTEERQLEQEEELQIKRKRSEAKRLAEERGLAEEQTNLSSKEATPEQQTSPQLAPVIRSDEPSQLPTPLATDDEDGDNEAHEPQATSKGDDDKNKDAQP